MADTPKEGETATPQVLENNTNNQGTVTPPAVVEPPKTEDSEVVKLRKEKEQAEMRANQLANQLKTRDEAEAEAKAKELEDQNKFKELYEQERTKREAIETEAEEKERKAELTKVKQEVLADFDESVRELAEEAGMDLANTDETTVAAFKEKLDKISKRVVSSGKVKGNNPSPSGNTPELSGDELKMALKTDDSFHEVVMSKFPGIAAMTTPKRS